MRYLYAVPDVVRDGLRLVHNFPPGRPRRRPGSMGFRFWVEPVDDNDRRAPCGCDWDAPAHFTTRR
jgi:hypothetical protein